MIQSDYALEEDKIRKNIQQKNPADADVDMNHEEVQNSTELEGQQKRRKKTGSHASTPDNPGLEVTVSHSTNIYSAPHYSHDIITNSSNGKATLLLLPPSSPPYI